MREYLFRLPVPESKKTSWLIVAVFSAFIFLTIPLARIIQKFFEEWLGARAYFIAASVMGMFVALVVTAFLIRRHKRLIALKLGWLAVMLLSAVWVMRNQLQTPAEAVHFFEYAMLGFLLFRAWSHDIHDRLIYPTAAVSLLIIAAMDEFLQWLMPGRYWDFRDLRLNVMAGLFIQGTIALVVNPSGIYGPIPARSVRIFCKVTLIALAIMGGAISNTPARVDIYATRIPFMRFISSVDGVMTEYGYRIVDPDVGTFNSRFTAAELLKRDQENGDERGAVIRRYRALTDYHDFIQIFSAKRDPLLHEMRVHLYRRDFSLTSADAFIERDRDRYIYYMTIAYYENQLLEKYFTKALVAADMVWSKESLAVVERNSDTHSHYTSPLSSHLVTLASELELWVLLVILATMVGFVYYRYGREPAPSLQ